MAKKTVAEKNVEVKSGKLLVVHDEDKPILNQEN